MQKFKGIIKETKRANIEEILKVVSYFPKMVNDEENERLFRIITKEELLFVLNSFKKDRSSGLDG